MTYRNVFALLPVVLLLLVSVGVGPAYADLASTDGVADALGQGWGYGLLVVFGLGLLLNLTPCVYPMVPITVGYFGNRRTESLARRCGDALLYLLGMALIYTLLGAMAALTGRMLGQALQSPLVQGTLALVMALMAAAMFGMFELSFSSVVEEKFRVLADGLGTFGMGMTLGVAAAPCLAPSTVALLGYVGQQGSLATGALLFFVLSIGLGLPYVLLAVFSGAVDYLPESGVWFEWVEKFIGYLLVGVALYFLWPLVPTDWLGVLVIAWITVSVLGLSISIVPSSGYLAVARTVALVVVGSLGIYWALFNMVWLAPKLDWTEGTTFVERGGVTQRTMVYTTAEWCVPCQEMKVTTFQDDDVRRAAQGVELVKIDMTDAPPEPVARWADRYDLQGIPTTFFLRANGDEIEELRGEGYLSGDDLSRRLRVFKSRTNP